MHDSKESGKQLLKAESDDDETWFGKSLQELRGLCSQLHHAAEYCETTFLNAEEKTAIVENTKEYVSKAVVTVIDHLGSISANLECLLSKSDTISETELRMDSLKQRLVTCQHYSNRLALSKFCGNAELTRYHPRYISPPTSDSQTAEGLKRTFSTPISAKAGTAGEFDVEEEMPLFLYTFNCKPSLIQDLTRENNLKENNSHSAPPVLPVRDELSGLPKPRPHFQFQEARKLKRSLLNWKSVQNKDLISLIRRGRRTSS